MMKEQGAKQWAAGVRSRAVWRLPRPGEGVGFEQLRFCGLPVDMLSTTRQEFSIGGAEPDGAVLVDLEQGNALRQALGRKDDGDFEAVGAMLHGCFTPASGDSEPVTNGAVDADVEDIAAPFCFAQRDKDAVLVPATVAVNGLAGTAAVVGEDIALAPDVVDIGTDMVLEQTDRPPLVIDGLLAVDIAQFEGVLEIEDFVEANRALRVDAFEQVPGSEDDRNPVRVHDPEEERPEEGAFGLWCRLRFGHAGHYRQRRGPGMACQEYAQQLGHPSANQSKPRYEEHV